MAEYLEAEPARKKAAAEATKTKLEQLERKLASSEDVVEGKKRRFEDTEYIEQSREIVENVKSAVSIGTFRIIICNDHLDTYSWIIGLLKKRKKAKVAPVVEEPVTETVAETILNDPATAPVIAVATVATAVAAGA